MTRLQDQPTTPQIKSDIPARRRFANSVVNIPDTRETDFEQLAQELFPTHYDIRKRPR